MVRKVGIALLFASTLAGCRSLHGTGEVGVGEEGTPPEPPLDEPPLDEPPLPVKKVKEEIVVAAWAEPSHLSEGGGQAQILVRVQKRGGAPFPDVEVRLSASKGSLYSKGAILKTNARGMTRDRLSTQKTAVVTLNAGGTRYRFRVPVGDDYVPTGR
jgi:hypothetical protein